MNNDRSLLRQRHQLRAELTRLAGCDDLARDVYEVVTKSL